MAAHTAVAAFTDTLYYISASLPATYDEAGYTASSMVFTAIGKMETFPEFGSQQTVNEFTPISGSVEYSKGVEKFGSGDAVMGDVPADPGQVIMKAASNSQNHYSMCAVFPDGEEAYFDVLIASWKLSQAKSGAFMTRTATIAFCKEPVVVAAV